MTTLKDRPNTALLVVDVQNDVVAAAHKRDEVIANINTLVDKARAENVPVIWVQHAREELVTNTRGLEVRARAAAQGLGTARAQEVRRLTRGHDARI